MESSLADRPPMEVIPGVLHLTYTTNSGGAFGLGQSASWLFAGATIVVVGIIVVVSTRLTGLGAVALGLVLGGALGNLTDRAIRGPGLSGRVIDFIDVRVWPVFNIADSAVLIGAVLLAVASFRPSRRQADDGGRAPSRAGPARHRRRRAPRDPASGGPARDRRRQRPRRGRPQAKAHRLAGGERLTVDLARARVLEPEGPGVPVPWRDEHLAVVAKPAGMATHPTEGRRSGTLVNRLIAMGLPLAPGDDPLRPGIVHRLDAGTSGLLVVALDEEARDRLSEMFRRHDVERCYLAVVRGDPDHERFVVDAPLGRRGGEIRLDAVTGRRAETGFRGAGAVRARGVARGDARTGRILQIRVHLSSVGHPILGCPVRWWRRRRQEAGPVASVPALVADRFRASGHGGADRRRGSAARRPRGGASAGQGGGLTRRGSPAAAGRLLQVERVLRADLLARGHEASSTSGGSCGTR